MATLKQKKTFQKVMETGGNVSSAMRISGYTGISAKNPQKLTESVGWKQLMDEYYPDTLLGKVGNDGLHAEKRYKGEKEPDLFIRHMYFDTILKLKNKFPKEQTGYQEIPITLNVYGQNKRLTGRIDRLHAADHGGRETVPGTELAPESPQDDLSSPSDGSVDHPDT